MDYGSMYPWDKKEHLKEVSYYKTHLRIRELRENGCTMSKKYESFVKIVECRESEHVCCDELSGPDGPFCYFYVTIFKKVIFHIPLSIFKKRTVNLAQRSSCPTTSK